MTYAQITGTTITTTTGRLPDAARRLDTQQWVLGLPDATATLQQATGWFEVVDVARPADDATTTYDRTVELVAGTPTVVWTARAKTADELTSDTAQANRSTVDTAITAALAELQTLIDAPAVADVPAGTLTTAQLSNVARATRDAVQQNRAGAQTIARTLRRLIRLVRGDFDGID